MVNRDRKQFAKKWKTFFEVAGGVGGFSGYLTVLRHYSCVVYFHLFLLVPLGWLYMAYYDQISRNTIGADFKRLFSIDGIFEVYSNAILLTGIPIVVMILFFLWDLFYLRHRTSGKRNFHEFFKKLKIFCRIFSTSKRQRNKLYY